RADVHPGAYDPWDAIDHDCDLRIDDLPYEDVSVRLEGPARGAAAGQAVARIGDADDDGLPDLLGSAPFDQESGRSEGRVYLITDRNAPVVSLLGAHATLMGSGIDDRFGASISAADLDGDGHDDVVVGSGPLRKAHGVAWVFRGPLL